MVIGGEAERSHREPQQEKRTRGDYTEREKKQIDLDPVHCTTALRSGARDGAMSSGLQ